MHSVNLMTMKRLFGFSLFWVLLLAGCAPPQPPAPPPAQQGCNCSMTSIIFFDPGTATLSAKNVAALQQDANFYAKQAPNPVVVTGGADLAEAANSPGISLQRAQAVAAQLAQDGVPPANIVVQDAGTQHLMIPTGPGGSQIMNRYVMTRIQVAPVASAPAPAGPFQVTGAVLYQPNAMLVARLGTDGARPLAMYLRQISAAMAQVIAAAPARPGVSAALVVGVKPDGAVRTWLVAPAGAFSPELAEQLQTAAEAVPPMEVQNGPIAFAVEFNAWGGGAPITDARHPVPMPQEWMQGAPPGPELVPDGVFARIWK